MKQLLMMSVLTLAAFVAGCAPPASNGNTNLANSNSNANSNMSAKTAPTKEALIALETKAFEAWKNKDGKFFETFLTTNFVGFTDKGERPDRASSIKMITDSKCEVKTFAFSEEKITNVSPDVAVLTLKSTSDYTCDGKPGPSPAIAATVYVREGTEWKAAYHNEVPVVAVKADATKPASTNTNQANAASTKTAPTTTPSNTTANVASNNKTNTTANTTSNTTANTNASGTAGDLTAELTALETAGWEAWKARDAKKMDEMIAKEMTFVDMMGNVYATRADTLKNWTEPKCDVRSVSITNTKAYSIATDVAILTYKGGAQGTCEGMALKPAWGTTVFVKEGGVWKTAYMFSTPA